MPYDYNIKPTLAPLTFNELYEGRLVCFNDITTNPNNVGTLELSKNVPGAFGKWTAIINGVRYFFNANGAKVEDTITSATTPILYGVEYDTPIIPEQSGTRTRTSSETGKSDTVSLKSMTPKDYFACHALTALIQKIDNPLSMDDGKIALLAAKSYKIAQAMAIEAYGSRENDNASSTEAGTDYVEVDSDNLTNDTDRLLYNINESIKANTKSNKETGIKISNIDKVKFDGTPTVKLDATSEVKVTQLPNVTISGTPNVNVANTPDVNVTNMPTEPISVSGNVNVTGTVSVDNFPE